MSKKIKVRFNLGRGPNYMKWKITYPSGTIEYASPTSTQIVMKGCTLKNSRTTAEKIFNGQHKTVCAWILCNEIEVKFSEFKSFEDTFLSRAEYNPRVKPYWTIKGSNSDNLYFGEITTEDKILYITKI
jgi:hypothetical protein